MSGRTRPFKPCPPAVPGRHRGLGDPRHPVSTPILILSLFVAAHSAATGQVRECLDCHDGRDPTAPRVLLSPGAAHAELACAECHPGVEPPCRDVPKAATCDTCHGDTADRMAGAEHTAHVAESAAVSPEPGTPHTTCRACHEPSAHAVRRAGDPASPASRDRVSETCLACHASLHPRHAARFLGGKHHAPAPGQRTEAATCADCHGSHVIDSPRRPASRVHRANVAATCGGCHRDARTEYENSVHGRAAARNAPEAPVCTGCHDAHAVPPRRGGTDVVAACSACHAAERVSSAFRLRADRLSSFSGSYHGLALRLGDDRVANCGSCHGHHAIRPPDDPSSTVHPDNLGTTCGACHARTCGGCHDPVPARFVRGTVHVTPDRPSHPVVGVVRSAYIGLTGLLVSLMVLHHILDLRAKIGGGAASARGAGRPAPRLSASERIQRAALTLSFWTLAVSGFALAFPESPLAWPFRAFPDAAAARRAAHRGSAAVLAGLALVHVCDMTLTRGGRSRLRLLWPVRRDARDARRDLAGGDASQPPIRLAEKAEYWARAWGTAVMTLTGLPLLAIDFSLAHIRLWAIELAQTIHFWEAVLAVATAVIWRGYAVFIDPAARPLNRPG